MVGPQAVTSAVVLAGGLGTRLRDTVPDVPKPMAAINGRPFLEIQLDYWIAQGITDIVLSVGYRREVIQSHFGERYRGARIRYAVEEQPLGTGGGLLVSAGLMPPGRPFLVLNGDTFIELRLDALAAFHAAHGSQWTFALFRTREAGRYMGMDVGADGRVRALRITPPAEGEFLANGGVYLVEPGVLQSAGWRSGDKVSLEDEVLPALHRAGCALHGMAVDGRFIDIGVPGDYFRAADLLQAESRS